MVVQKRSFQPNVMYDTGGNAIDSVLVAGIRRLAVQADLAVSEIQIGAVELDDAEGSTRAAVRQDGQAFPASITDFGGLLLSGRDDVTPATRHVRVDVLGRLITAPAAPVPVGATILSGAPTPIVIPGPAVPLPPPPAGTVAMIVQHAIASAPGLQVEIRELGSGGAGVVLPIFGTVAYSKSIAPLEAVPAAGAGFAQVNIQFGVFP